MTSNNTQVDDVVMPDIEIEPNDDSFNNEAVENVVGKKEKTRNVTDRLYFVEEVETGKPFVTGLSSEKECLNAIINAGEFDTKYRIGYCVYQIKPIIKQARIQLKK